ncbi:hypothetical protein CsatA_029936 [Cannabis sativa]
MLKRVHSLVTKDISSLNVESESDLKGTRSGKSEMSPLNLLNTSVDFDNRNTIWLWTCGA